MGRARASLGEAFRIGACRRITTLHAHRPPASNGLPAH
ncbi:MAG: hypothetical protein AVDCRST_MAG11-377 [uncultured Gemmatimonadaceae bacterium]|uniref:Uncharacterized protein n=1 Tax=uncultured Gemmatimonadaceae bacterium TaxID=246130 RepID=A0A6J4K3P1_9BACT|nr:MAG: hypothetical protein AVDCRST_MAG11-377 [uncultured Gemmatimonadaceae bacterium]